MYGPCGIGPENQTNIRHKHTHTHTLAETKQKQHNQTNNHWQTSHPAYIMSVGLMPALLVVGGEWVGCVKGAGSYLPIVCCPALRNKQCITLS